jgi:hypothetical protein
MENTFEVGNKSSNIQLAFLGFVSFFIGVVCMISMVFVYGYEPLTNISESATTGNAAGMILPFALGCMFTYTIGYLGYCLSERILARIMGICFFVVAMQVCNSLYVTETRVGLLGVSPELSDIIHMCATSLGFGLMFIWITFYFTRSNKEKTERTRQKIIRNKIYIACGTAMFCGLAILIISYFVPMGRYIVFIGEELILIPAGFAIVVKSGLFLRDKSSPNNSCGAEVSSQIKLN